MIELSFRSGKSRLYQDDAREDVLNDDNSRRRVPVADISPGMIVSGSGLVLCVERQVNGTPERVTLPPQDRTGLPVRSCGAAE